MFEEGDVVKVISLSSHAILNGMEGIVTHVSENYRCSVLIAGKCISIKNKNLKKHFNPVSFSLRKTIHQQQLESFLKKKLLPREQVKITESKKKTISRSVGVMTELQPTIALKLEESEDVQSEAVPVNTTTEEKREEAVESKLFNREGGGLFRRKKPSSALFNPNSQMSSLLNKMNSLGAVDTPKLASIPHMPKAPDLTKIFGTTKPEQVEGESVKQAKNGMAAMLDISVDDILSKVEGLGNSKNANDPRVMEMMTVVDLIKEVRNSKAA